jgi:mannosyltransferase
MQFRDHHFSPDSSLSAPGPGRRLPPAILLASLTLIAAALRFSRLGNWNFQATEMFTLRDSFTPQFENSRPLGYLLNYFLVKPFLPLDELGLRLLPAVFGVLAIPVLYLVSRRLLGTRAALFSALLLTFSPLHVMYSQLARYWSLVFLLSAIYPYALYIGVRERNRRALALGLVTAVLATLAHPTSLLLLGGPALLLATRLKREHVARVWSQNTVRWTALFLVLVVAIIAWRFVPILEGWISAHDRNPGSGQFLQPSFRQGPKQVFYLLAFVEGLTLPLVVAGVVGIYLIGRERDRLLALFLASVAAFPIAFLTLISIRTPVSQYYLLPAVPVFFLGAGAFLDRLLTVDWGARPRWLLPASLVTVVVAAGIPTLVSEYLNGRRYDFRSMAQWLAPRLEPGDVVFSDQPMVLAHYLPGTDVQRLRPDAAVLRHSSQQLLEAGRGGALWVVAPTLGHAFRTDLKRGGLIDWMYDNCQLRNITGKARVDFRQQYLQIYRCPPVLVPSTTVEHEPAPSPPPKPS